MQGTVVAVCTSAKKGQRKVDVGTAILIAGQGIEGDAHAGFAHRQISLLAVESIEKMKQKCGDLVPGDFAENLTVEGLNLPALNCAAHWRYNPESQPDRQRMPPRLRSDEIGRRLRDAARRDICHGRTRRPNFTR
jgi:hypothetical protein